MPVRVIALCFLPSLALAQLRRALQPACQVRAASTWNELIDQVARGASDLVIVDPCWPREREALQRVHELGAVLSHSARTPVMGYVAVTATAIHAVHALTRLGAVDIVVRGVDDRAESLAAAVRRASGSSAVEHLVHSVGNPFARVPAPIAAALQLAFRRPERFRSARDVARCAGTTRRSLDRWLARARLASARMLLACARVNAAFHLIAGGHVKPARAAVMLGYASERALARELRSLTGHTPSALRRRAVTSDALIATLGPRLLRSNGGPGVSRRASA